MARGSPGESSVDDEAGNVPLRLAKRSAIFAKGEVTFVRILAATVTAGLGAMLLSACSSASRNAYSALPNADVSPQLGVRTLYVNDRDKHAVIVLKQSDWKEIKDKIVTKGIKKPRGNWVDKLGNLYVANESDFGGDVTEYNSELSLIFTYNAYLFRPNAVTTDSAGNVYVADDLSTVVEYAQATNKVVGVCGLSAHFLLGVAVDRQGDVFISDYNGSGPIESIREYPGGLVASGCNSTVLPIAISPRGMVIDPHDNLVVSDDVEAKIDIIAPPYTSITGTFGSGKLVTPIDVTIDESGKQAYVTDEGARAVQVFSYPDGAVLATLGSANGLSGPTAAVDSNNYVP